MERYIFDPRLSLNPSCAPYKLSDYNIDDDNNIIPFSEITYFNDTDSPIKLNLNINACECGETIEIIMPGNIMHSFQASQLPKSWLDEDRKVIGNTSLSYLEGLKKDERIYSKNS
jgi:hypothetical protein